MDFCAGSASVVLRGIAQPGWKAGNVRWGGKRGTRSGAGKPGMCGGAESGERASGLESRESCVQAGKQGNTRRGWRAGNVRPGWRAGHAQPGWKTPGAWKLQGPDGRRFFRGITDCGGRGGNGTGRKMQDTGGREFAGISSVSAGGDRS